MDSLPKECILPIINSIFHIKYNDIIDGVNDKNIYSVLYEIGADMNMIDDVYKRWNTIYDRINQLKNIYDSSSNYIKAIINESFDMTTINRLHELTLNEIIALNKREHYSSILYNIRQKEKQFTHSNQTCICCDKMLPTNWINIDNHKDGFCSSACYIKTISKYPTLSVRCQCCECKREIHLIDLDYNIFDYGSFGHYCDDGCYEWDRHMDLEYNRYMMAHERY
jgi:hypothetical protein